MSIDSFKRGAVLGWLSLLVLGHPTRAVPFENNELENLIQEAEAQNPEVAAQRAKVESIRSRVPQAGSLEDPRLRLSATNIPLSDPGFDATPMSGKDFGLHQKIPFPGKLSLQKEAEKKALASAEALLEETKNRVRYQVQQTYFALYRIEKAIEVVRKNQTLLDSLSKVAESRYSVGQATGSDVFRAQSLETELENRLLALKQEKESMIVHMNSLLDRPPHSSLELQYDFSLSALPPKPDPTIIDQQPLLRALKSEIEQTDDQLRLAKRDYWPNFDLGVNYRQREESPGDPVEGSDFITGAVTLNIPLWAHWRQSRKVDEMAAKKSSAKYRYQAAQNQITYETEDAYRTSKRQLEQIDLFKGSLLPQTRATYESAYAAYQSGRTDFFSTMEYLKDLYETELAFYELQAAYQTSLARLEWLVGQELQEEQP